jgi:hypothetical protein
MHPAKHSVEVDSILSLFVLLWSGGPIEWVESSLNANVIRDPSPFQRPKEQPMTTVPNTADSGAPVGLSDEHRNRITDESISRHAAGAGDASKKDQNGERQEKTGAQSGAFLALENGELIVDQKIKIGDIVDGDGELRISVVLGHDTEVLAFICSREQRWRRKPQLRWVHKSQPLAPELRPVVRQFGNLLLNIREAVPWFPA